LGIGAVRHVVRWLTVAAAALVLSGCGHSGGSSSSDDSSAAAPTGCLASHHFAIPTVEQTAITHYGRQVTPLGHLSNVGNFSGGGALTPDGRYYWAIDTGKDVNYAWIIEVASGTVVQQLPLPGSGGHVVFTPDGRSAYVPGNPMGSSSFPDGTVYQASGGDAIHVYSVDPSTGLAQEQTPIAIPSSAKKNVPVGSSRKFQSKLATGENGNDFTEWPEDIAISPDGKTLLTALLNSDRAAIIDLPSGVVTVVEVGAYPRGAAIERSGKYGYIANSYDGTLSKIDLSAHSVVATLPLGLSGEDIGDVEAHVLALAADPTADQLYATAANRDLVLVLNTHTDTFTKRIDLRRAGGSGGLGVNPVGLAVAPGGCTLYVATAYENSIVSIALKNRDDSATKAFDIVGAIPTGDYPTGVALTGVTTASPGTLVWVAGKGMGTNKGQDGQAPPIIKQYWQRGIVGALDVPDDHFFAQMSSTVAQNLTPDAEPTPTATVVHGAQTGPFTYAPSAQIKYVFLVIKENRTYDNIFGSLTRGDGAPQYELYEDNCGADNTAFEGVSRTFPGCGITPNAHALIRRWPLLTQFYANSEQSEEGHVFTSGGFLTDYLQRNSHWEPSHRGRPYDTGIFPIGYPPKYFLFDQLLNAGISFRNFGERSGGLNPSPYSRGVYRTPEQFAAVQANTSVLYPFNGLGGCIQASSDIDPAPAFSGCFFDSGALGQSRASGANVAPYGAYSRMGTFASEFSKAMSGTRVWPQFSYVIQFNDHGQGDTPNNTTEPAQAADNDLALGQLVDLLSHSPIWPQTAIFVMEDDSQDGADHVDSHRMPAYVISPWALQGAAPNAPIITRRYDQLSMIRTIQLIFGLQPSSLLHTLAVPMDDVFIPPSATPDLTPYTAILPERSLIEQNGKTDATRNLARNAPELYALSQQLPWHQTDAVPQQLADRIHYANIWGDDHHYPGSGPNASRLERARAEAALAQFKRHAKIDVGTDDDDD